jgi:hypothetical protein
MRRFAFLLVLAGCTSEVIVEPAPEPEDPADPADPSDPADPADPADPKDPSHPAPAVECVNDAGCGLLCCPDPCDCAAVPIADAMVCGPQTHCGGDLPLPTPLPYAACVDGICVEGVIQTAVEP